MKGDKREGSKLFGEKYRLVLYETFFISSDLIPVTFTSTFFL